LLYRPEVHHADRVGQPDEEEERVDRERARPVDQHENSRSEQQRTDNEANRDERREPRPEIHRHPVSLLIRPKIGRYIAMTMPPTMPPRNAIISGSSSVSRPATATRIATPEASSVDNVRQKRATAILRMRTPKTGIFRIRPSMA